MTRDSIDLAEKMLGHLREEMLEAQRTRAQVIGFKITFVSTAIALLGANVSRIHTAVWIVPAIAAFFFDLLVNSYSVSIKRLGLYARHHLEPMLREGHGWPASVPTWEEFAVSQRWNSRLFLLGNVGLTGLAAVVAATLLLRESRDAVTVALTLGLAAMLVADTLVFNQRHSLVEQEAETLRSQPGEATT